MRRVWTWLTGGPPRGRLLWWQLAIEIAALLAVTWAVFALTGSSLLSWLGLLCALFAFTPMKRHAAQVRPFPPYTGPPPSRQSPLVRGIAFVVWVALVLALIVGSAWAAAEFGFFPGPAFWFILWFGAPLMILVNYHATQPPDAEWKSSPEDTTKSS